MSSAAVQLGKNDIPVSGGKMHVGGTVDMSSETPYYRLPGDVTVMDELQINRKFGKVFLSFINPVFAQVASLEGTVSLKTKDIDLPLGEEIQKSGSGSGHLDISNLKLKPTGILGMLMEFGGITDENSHNVKFSGVDFELKDGKVTYENFKMTFPGDFDLIFRGAVGFDDSLDLAVSLPIRAGLLKKCGVTGPIEQYAQVLQEDGARIEIPIIGSRLKPKLGKVDIKSIIDTAVKALLKKKGGGLLKGIFGGGSEKDQ
jgi:hypothetical protein